jgi:hypothetical protein
MPGSPYTEKATQDELASGGEPVALSALVDRGVKLEWHEAVAVVRDICQLLRGADPDELCRTSGTSGFARTGEWPSRRDCGRSGFSEPPVATLGRLLLSLVEEARMPVQLRIVALCGVDTPAYDSVDEFSNALAYFERPSGALPIRPVYTRWHQLAAESDAPTALQPLPPDLPPLGSQPPATQSVVDLTAPPDALGLFQPEKRVVTWHGRSFPVFPIAAAGAVILVATVILAWSFSARSRSSPAPTQAAQAPVEEAASPPIAQSSPMTEDIDLDAGGGPAARGSGAELWRRRSGPAPVVAIGTRSSKSGTSPTTPRFSPGPQPGLRAGGLAAPPPRVASRTAVPAPASPPASSRQPAVDERLPAPMGEPPDVIYGSSDQDVEPPILVRPRVSVDPPAGGELEGMTVLDLLISDSGQVETIKLAAPAQDYREAMIFSAVKTWKFRPGMRAAPGPLPEAIGSASRRSCAHPLSFLQTSDDRRIRSPVRPVRRIDSSSQLPGGSTTTHGRRGRRLSPSPGSAETRLPQAAARHSQSRSDRTTSVLPFAPRGCACTNSTG